MNRQQRLREAYEMSWPTLVSALATAGNVDELSYPQLMDLEAHNYLKSSRKVFVVGQQTEEWFGKWCDLENDSNGTPIPFLLNIYREFRLGIERRHTPFWSASHGLYGALNPTGPEDGFVWSNLIKMDEKGRRDTKDARPQLELEDLVCRTFNMLPKEIEFAEPEVVIFFTGPRYDERLGACLESELLPVEGWPLRELARVVDRHNLLPKHSYRTYHPGYLFRGKHHVWQKLRQEISKLCRH